MNDDPNSQDDADPLHRRGGVFGRWFSARPEGSPYPKAELLPRLLARITDFMLAAILPVTAGDAGAIGAVLYLLFADGLFGGQSPGKRLLGIKVVEVSSRRGAGHRQSALRNFPFAFALLLGRVPNVGGALMLGVGAAIIAFEGLQVLADTLGLRIGDRIAGTQVVDTKVLASQLRPTLKVVNPGGGHARAARVLLEPDGPASPAP